MYVKKSVPRAAGSPGLGLQVRDQLSLIDVDDILHLPAPDSKGVVIEENIVLKPGAYAVNIYMTPGTVELTSAADGDTDKVGFTPSVKFEHPGNEQEVREFKANNINRKFIVIVRYCSGKPADLIGTLCNPCKLTPSYTGNNDGNTNEMTLTQISKGDDIFIYKGTIPSEEPVDTTPGGELNVSSDGNYQITEGQITKVIGGSHGAVITLLGPSTGECGVAAENVKFKNGDVFKLGPGDQLTLRAFNTGEGNLLWLEQSRFTS